MEKCEICGNQLTMGQDGEIYCDRDSLHPKPIKYTNEELIAEIEDLKKYKRFALQYLKGVPCAKCGELIKKGCHCPHCKRDPSSFDISKTTEKVYVHDEEGTCVARLCKISGEIFLEGKLQTHHKCSFEKFRHLVFETFSIYINESYRPEWSNNESFKSKPLARLNELLSEAKMTQEDLAKRIGVDISVINSWDKIPHNRVAQMVDFLPFNTDDVSILLGEEPFEFQFH